MAKASPVAQKFFGSKRPIAIAHRGGGASFGAEKHLKENTFEAFERARKAGYEYLETDVIYTKDKQLIVIHVAKNRFEAAQRLKEAPSYYKLQRMTYRQIKTLLGRDIPRLEDLLLGFPKSKFFIDPKSDRAVKPLAEVIQKLGAGDRVLLMSFYVRRIKKLRRLLGASANLGLIIGRYPAFMNRNLFLSRHGGYEKLGLRAVGLPKMLMSYKNVSDLQANGYRVVVWTLNTPSEINQAMSLAVDGIISDDIQLLKELM